MRIAIDAHMVGTGETGNETYVLNLLKGLAMVDQTNTYDICTIDRALLPAELGKVENFQPVEVRPASSFLRIPFAMPYKVWRRGIDLLHVTYTAPPLCPCPTMVAVHDLSYLHFPEAFSLRDRLVLKTLVPRSIRQAARVIAISESTKKDIVHNYGLPADRIVVTPLAAGAQYHPIREKAILDATRRRYGLEGHYILTVGNLEPRKNLACLIEAYGQLHSMGIIKHRLVLAGKAKRGHLELVELVRKLGLKNKVIFTGYVSSEDLPSLYNAADLFVFPSLHEGFGLPAVEAMACGTPVITSRTSSFPEVVGDAAIMIDPHDVEGLAKAMKEVLTQENLGRELSAKGLKRARSFSWEKTARQTLAVYKEVYAEAKGQR